MSDRPDDDLTVPKAGKGDVVYTLSRAGISAIPFFGGAAKELLGLVIAPPLQRRTINWMNAIAQRLKQLEHEVEGFKLEDLQNNQLFLTVVLHATAIALRTHQEEKLQVLQNAVVNTARGINIDENVQLIFLNATGDLTPLHLQLLRYFQAPKKWLDELGIQIIEPGGADVGLEKVFPQLARDIYEPIVQDLFNRGLIITGRDVLHSMTQPQGIVAPRTTELGNQFLEYISDWRPAICDST